MTRRPKGVATAAAAVAAVAMLLALGGCTEKPQTQGLRKAESNAWDGPATAYSAQGWKTGDATSWERQMKVRSQGQDEYSRPGSQ